MTTPWTMMTWHRYLCFCELDVYFGLSSQRRKLSTVSRHLSQHVGQKIQNIGLYGGLYITLYFALYQL